MNESELNRTAALAGVATVDLGGPGAGQCLRNGTADGREDRPVEDDHGCPGNVDAAAWRRILLRVPAPDTIERITAPARRAPEA